MCEHHHEHPHTHEPAHEHHHEHPHTHEHGHEHHHEHPHTHEHGHEHPHSHESGESSVSREEQLALLTYMLHHNRHHAEELHDMAHSIGGEAAALIHEAVHEFEAGNAKLEAALALFQKGAE